MKRFLAWCVMTPFILAVLWALWPVFLIGAIIAAFIWAAVTLGNPR